MKKTILTILLLAIAVGVWCWFRGFHGSDKNAEVFYRRVKIGQGTIIQEVTATGTVNPIKEVEVGAQVNGKVISLKVDYNSKVTEGQIVAQIDPATYEASYNASLAQLNSAKATLEKTQAQLTLAEKELKRLKALLDRKMVSDSEYDSQLSARDQLLAEIKINKASIEQAEANVKKTKTDLDYCTIASPVTGVVLSRNVDEGQTVVSNMSASTLLKIATDLSRIQVEASVPEADVGQLQLGQEVNFTVDAYKDTFHGKVKEIRLAATTASNVVTYPVIVEAENPDEKLFPGMTATISIIVSQAKDVLTVPTAALRYAPENAPAPKDAGQVIWLADDPSHIHPVPVEVGISDGINVQISSDVESLEGKEVATGVMTAEELKKSKAKEETNPFMMRPPGGGRRPGGPGGPGGGPGG
ncbi:MAG: efflux RND transporter periplasmic adaptor subunit, partial [Victivallales bacterium]|nr:efflux RND transporter periplasmic adaptor subunit [Victivallales bacterium]